MRDRSSALRRLTVGLLLLTLVAALVPAPLVARQERDEALGRGASPKVVVIAGPVGAENVEEFRDTARKGAQEARRWTDNVVEIYTPNATWDVVKDALQGASIVVYVGHGNGWPSKYRDSLYERTQNGLGLNPRAGTDDNVTHQYYGSDYLRREVKLAPNAVVLLHRLCYASGNTEPGLPEGTLAMSKQRVDNYAAGFLDIGAEAVVAEGQMGPAWYIEQLLGGDRSIKDIWFDSPRFHDHVLTFPSARKPGYTAFMDPNRMDGPTDPDPDGFYRSLVARVDAEGGTPLTATMLRASAAAAAANDAPTVDPGELEPFANPEPIPTPPPTLRERGFIFGQPRLEGNAHAARDITLKVPVERPRGKRLPRAMTLSVRWDPILVEGEPVKVDPESPQAQVGVVAPPVVDPNATPVPTPSPTPEATPSPTPKPKPASPPKPGASASGGSGAPAAPTGSPTPVASFAPTPEPVLSMVPESLGNVVLTEDVNRTREGFDATIPVPPQAGLYRLVTVLQDREGVPLADDGVPFIAPQMVRVLPSLSVDYLTSPRVGSTAGARFSVPVAVTNDGTRPWQPQVKPPKPTKANPKPPTPKPAPSTIVAQWVSLAGRPVQRQAIRLPLPALMPGKTAFVKLPVHAPDVPGKYLLLIDIVTPTHGSLAATGLPFAVVRVTLKPSPPVQTGINPG